MGIRFLLGRPGSGKTRRVLAEVADLCRREPLGAPVILLVPEQASYQAERDLLEIGGLGGTTRAMVLSFTRLATYAAARLPITSLPPLTANHRQILATLLVIRRRRAGGSNFFAANGIEEALAEFVAEAHEYGATPDALRAAARAMEQNPGERVGVLLKEKLQFAAEFLDEFDRTARTRFEDPQDSMRSVNEALMASDLLQGARIYADGFWGYTPVEESFLVALARRSADLTITLATDPARGAELLAGKSLKPHPVFAPAEETLARLRVLFERNGLAEPQVDVAKHARENEGLRHLEAGFFQKGASANWPTESIELHECASPREEARLAAETAARWKRLYGWSDGQIGIMARDLETYAPHLEEALRTLKVNYFLDRSAPLRTHPIVTGIQLLVRAATQRDRTELLVELGKSGLLPLPRWMVDLLEAHVVQHPRTVREWYAEEPWGPPPSRHPFDDEPVTTEPRKLHPMIDRARLQITRVVMRFRNVWTALSASRGPANLFLSALVDAISETAGAQDWEPTDERILQRVGELLAEMLEVLGDEEVEWDLAAELVNRCLATLTLPRIPPMLDEMFVGQVDRSRQPRLEGLIVLGVAEGSFPRAGTNGSLLNDAERDLLGAAGVELRPSARKLFDREAYLAWKAFSSPSRCLALSRPRATGNGSPAHPSPYWEEVRRLFPLVTPASSDRLYTIERAWRPRELAAAVLRDMDGAHEANRRRRLASAGLLQVASPDVVSEISAVYTFAGWENRAAVSPELAAEFWRRNLRLSVTQLDTFGRCPFQHFVRYMLRPAEFRRAEIRQIDAGNYCHAVLRNLTAMMRDARAAGEVDEARVKTLLEEARRDPTLRMEQTGLLAEESGRILFAKINEALDDLALWIHATLRQFPFFSIAEELAVGDEKAPITLNPLTIDPGIEGWTAILRGKFDRIDTDTRDGRHLLLIDYKLRRKDFAFDRWMTGENFQIPIYLLLLRSQERWDIAGGLFLEILPRRNADGTSQARVYRGIFRNQVLQDFMPGVDVRKLGFMSGAAGNVEEKPRAWGSLLVDREFEALLARTEQMAREHAGRIASGAIDIAPSRHGTASACGMCDSQAFCGVDFRLNRPRIQNPPPRVHILEMLRNT